MKQFLLSAAAVVLGLVITLDAHAKDNHGGSHGSPHASQIQSNQLSKTNHTKDLHKEHSLGKHSGKKFTLNKKFDLRKHGKKKLHWNRRWWCSRFSCYCYYCPEDSCSYFWVPTCHCYVPDTYGPSLFTMEADGPDSPDYVADAPPSSTDEPPDPPSDE